MSDGLNKWWNPVTVALLAMVLVVGVVGVKMTLVLNRVNDAVHGQCLEANQTSDVWNTLVNQGIAREQKSTDDAVTKASKIHDLEVIKFPKQACS